MQLNKGLVFGKESTDDPGAVRRQAGGWAGVYPGACLAVDVLSVDVPRQRIELGLCCNGTSEHAKRKRPNAVPDAEGGTEGAPEASKRKKPAQK